MTVERLYAWRTAGCGDLCRPQLHDLSAHERYGYELCRAEYTERTVRTGNLTVELRSRRVWVDGAQVTVTGREWGILAYLAERLGHWCPNDDIVRAVWGPEWLFMPPVGVRFQRAVPHLLHVNLNRLRPRLGSAAELISTGWAGSQTGGGLRLEEVPAW
jgi:DNA-binding response OmpR family regulator